MEDGPWRLDDRMPPFLSRRRKPHNTPVLGSRNSITTKHAMLACPMGGCRCSTRSPWRKYIRCCVATRSISRCRGWPPFPSGLDQRHGVGPHRHAHPRVLISRHGLGRNRLLVSRRPLYRMIAAEWLDPDWEDALVVENSYYREVHFYCESREGFDRAHSRRIVYGVRSVLTGSRRSVPGAAPGGNGFRLATGWKSKSGIRRAD